MKNRKCSTRILFVDGHGFAVVITQDSRRRMNPITGYRSFFIGHPSRDSEQIIARREGCSFIVRRKR